VWDFKIFLGEGGGIAVGDSESGQEVFTAQECFYGTMINYFSLGDECKAAMLMEMSRSDKKIVNDLNIIKNSIWIHFWQGKSPLSNYLDHLRALDSD